MCFYRGHPPKVEPTPAQDLPLLDPDPADTGVGRRLEVFSFPKRQVSVVVFFEDGKPTDFLWWTWEPKTRTGTPSYKVRRPELTANSTHEDKVSSRRGQRGAQ